MDERDRIRDRMERGEIPEEDGMRLLEAYAEAEARDAVVRGASARRRGRRGLRRNAALVVGLALVTLAGALFAVALTADRGERAPEGIAERLADVDPAALDARIAGLEEKLRRPGSAADYRALARAYGERYRRQGAETDLESATRADARAERLERREPMRGSATIFGLALAALVVAGLIAWMMLMYNGLVKREERVDERWAQVETVLQRRLDLVPQLVETVKGYATHERETLLQLTEARARALGTLEGIPADAPTGAGTVEAVGRTQAEVTRQLGRLLALAERYPDLKASGNFLALQDQLEGTENRIAVERQRYNDAVRVYNQRLRIFPANLVGGLFGFAPRAYFESRSGAEEPVEVDFQGS